MSNPDCQPKKSIRQLRQERGWAQLDVAVHLKVHATTVSDWERGAKLPRRGMQQRLADLFGVSAEAIAFGPVDEQP